METRTGWLGFAGNVHSVWGPHGIAPFDLAGKVSHSGIFAYILTDLSISDISLILRSVSNTHTPGILCDWNFAKLPRDTKQMFWYCVDCIVLKTTLNSTVWLIPTNSMEIQGTLPPLKHLTSLGANIAIWPRKFSLKVVTSHIMSQNFLNLEVPAKNYVKCADTQF